MWLPVILQHEGSHLPLGQRDRRAMLKPAVPDTFFYVAQFSFSEATWVGGCGQDHHSPDTLGREEWRGPKKRAENQTNIYLLGCPSAEAGDVGWSHGQGDLSWGKDNS